MSLITWSLVTLSCLSLAAAEPAHFPITRRTAAGEKSFEYWAIAADALRLKYGYTPSSSTLPSVGKRGNSAGVSIINQDSDTSYLATISIGTPGQNFNIVLDTGSSDLWVVDSSCATCATSTPSFKSSSSSSFEMATTSSGQPDVVQIQYGSGAVQGDLVRDTVSMGGFTVTQQQWLLVDQTSQSLLSGTNAGIMGLAFEALANTQATPFWQALANGGQFTTPEMSFWMNRLLGTTNESTEKYGGVFTLGGTNSSLYTGDIEYLNLATSGTQKYWLLQVSQVTVQGKTVTIPTGDSANAAIDTGTTLIGAPSAAVTAIYAAIPGSQALDSQNLAGFYGYPCDTDVTITISYGGKAWPINSADMNLGRPNATSDLCVGGIFDLTSGSTIEAGGGNPSWVVGDTFLKNVYSVFRSDPASVGFAELSSAAGGSSGSPSSVPSSVPSTASVPSGSPGSGSGTGTGSGSGSTAGAGSSSGSSGALSSITLPSSILVSVLAISLAWLC